jgi:hypothetical protein
MADFHGFRLQPSGVARGDRGQGEAGSPGAALHATRRSQPAALRPKRQASWRASRPTVETSNVTLKTVSQGETENPRISAGFSPGRLTPLPPVITHFLARTRGNSAAWRVRASYDGKLSKSPITRRTSSSPYGLAMIGTL